MTVIAAGAGGLRMRPRRALAIHLTAAALAVSAAAVPAKVIGGGEPQLTRTVGGGGGEWLRTECDGVRYLAGLQMRYGNWIDAVGINCADAKEYEGKGRLDNPGSTPILMWGGTGGAETNQLCSTDEVVGGVRIQRSPNNFVGYISVLCASLNNPGRDLREASFRGAGRISDKSPPVETIVCPSGTVAVGIHGATGLYVDRFGLVCVNAPQFIADAPIIFVPLPQPEPIKVTGEIERDVPIGAYTGMTSGGSAVDPKQIPPDPISPGTVIPILPPPDTAQSSTAPVETPSREEGAALPQD